MGTTIIFDMDGVIFDSERVCLSCWSTVAEDWKLGDVEAVFRKCIGTNDHQTRMIVEEAYAPEYGEGIADRLLAESAKLWHLRYDEKPLPVKKGVKEILEYLRQMGVPVGLATSTRRAKAEEELKMAGLLSYFDGITGGDAVRISKPDPEIYRLACGEMKAEPGDVIAIEDSYNGIRSAHAAGIRPIMVPDMIPADDEMRSLSLKICGDLLEVKDYLEEQVFR